MHRLRTFRTNLSPRISSLNGSSASTLPKRTAHSSKFIATSTIRSYTTLNARPRSGIKIGYLFSGLALLGLTATSYGLYLFYNSFTTWPKSVREPLRSAIRAKEFKDYLNAEKFYRKALEQVEKCEPTQLGSSPRDSVSKISGLYIAFAGFLEEMQRPGEALEIYEATLDRLNNSSSSPAEEARKIGLSQKIGTLAMSLGGPQMAQKAEKHLSESVTALLKLSSSDQQRVSAKERAEKGATGLDMQELQLPAWVSTTDLGASMENLGSFYLAQGNGEYAATLFIQALNILLPPYSPDITPPSKPDRCHGATLANNISSAFVLNPTSENLTKAETWANNAIHMARHTLQAADRTQHPEDALECGSCLAVGLFNLGLLKEMQGDREAAIRNVQDAFKQARSVRFVEGAQQCLAALDRLQSKKED